MKIPMQDLSLKSISEAISKNMNPKCIVMHPTAYRSLSISKGGRLFNTLFGLDVIINDSAPKDNFFIR